MTRVGNYRGRPYSKTTRLGRIMEIKGVEKLYEFAAEIEISPRQLSKYLNGAEIRPDHLVVLAEVLGIDGKYIQEVENGGERYTNTKATSSVGASNGRTDSGNQSED